MQERKRKDAEDYRNSLQQSAQAKAQALRYEDELARNRMKVLKGLLFFISLIHLL
jgi:hypothetical protein